MIFQDRTFLNLLMLMIFRFLNKLIFPRSPQEYFLHANKIVLATELKQKD